MAAKRLHDSYEHDEQDSDQPGQKRVHRLPSFSS